jgi:tRNA modification GTPase
MGAAKASFNLLQGSLSNKISNVLDKIVSLSASMAAWVDYPDEEIPELDEKTLKNTLSFAKNELKELLDNYESGMIMTQGVNTVIAGRPNAGKSTLMNMLSGKEKSIVTHIEGTTRDIVENSVRLGSLVLHLSDTAGLRESDDVVEAIGIKKALERIDTASLVLAVFDSSRELDDDDKMLIDSCKGKKAVAVINKTDLSPKINTYKIKDNFELLPIPKTTKISLPLFIFFSSLSLLKLFSSKWKRLNSISEISFLKSFSILFKKFSPTPPKANIVIFFILILYF